jgi:CBS domain-containing protein
LQKNRQNFNIPVLPFCKTVVSFAKLLPMRKVADILRRKGNRVTTVVPSTTVLSALHIMADTNIGSVVVMDGTTMLGIMTERDYSRKVVLNGRSSTDTTVAEIMSNDFPRVTENDTIEFCMQLMSKDNLRYLPVMDNGKLAGIISINDVVTETILTQQETISHLQSYIHS